MIINVDDGKYEEYGNDDICEDDDNKDNDITVQGDIGLRGLLA